MAEPNNYKNSNVNLELQNVMSLSPKKRVRLLADLIIDKIKEDQRNGAPLLKRVMAEEASKKKSKPKK